MKVISAELLTLPDMRQHAEAGFLAEAVCEWAAHMPLEKPMCFCCEHTWRSYSEPMPVAFMVMRVFDKPDELMLSGLCRACALSPDINEKAKAVLQKLWPDLQMLNAPTSVQ